MRMAWKQYLWSCTAEGPRDRDKPAHLTHTHTHQPKHSSIKQQIQKPQKTQHKHESTSTNQTIPWEYLNSARTTIYLDMTTNTQIQVPKLKRTWMLLWQTKKQKEGLHLSSTKITQVNIRFLTISIFIGHRLVRVSCNTDEIKDILHAEKLQT